MAAADFAGRAGGNHQVPAACRDDSLADSMAGITLARNDSWIRCMKGGESRSLGAREKRQVQENGRIVGLA